MPTWPTLYPLYLHYKTDLPFPWDKTQVGANNRDMHKSLFMRNFTVNLKNSDLYYRDQFNLSPEKLQMLYECEEERHVYKACLREMITLKRSEKHTSWKTADVSALYLS